MIQRKCLKKRRISSFRTPTSFSAFTFINLLRHYLKCAFFKSTKS